MVRIKMPLRKPKSVHGNMISLGLGTERTGHVSFSAPGRAGDEDVAVLCDVFTVRHAFDQRFVKLPAGVIVDRGDGSIGLLELCFADQPF